MLSKLSAAVVKLIKSAAKGLTLQKRRAFQATVAEQFCDGSSRKAESMFGWGRDAVEAGLQKQTTGVSLGRGGSVGGRRRTEDRLPQLVEDIQVSKAMNWAATMTWKSSTLQPTKVLVRSARKHYPW